jgi:hypothetical protein
MRCSRDADDRTAGIDRLEFDFAGDDQCVTLTATQLRRRLAKRAAARV